MTTNQLFFAILGTFLGVVGLLIGVVIKYMDAKIDPIGKQVDILVQYMISHEGRISILEERTKNK
jgi:ABC-type lipoprotein release transport system permease subunit